MGSSSTTISRRNLLRLSGLTLASAFAGCGKQTRTNKEDALKPYISRFNQVINIRNQDVDRTGSDKIDSVLGDLLSNGTAVYFPPGTYRLSKLDLSNLSNCGLIADRATLRAPSTKQENWIFGEPTQNFVFDGFTLDYTPPTAAPVIALTVEGQYNILRNLSFKGSRGPYPRSGLQLNIQKPSAKLVVERVHMRGGSKNGSAIYTHPGEGTLHFIDCHIENWYEGLYASPHSGPLTIKGGIYANNGIDQIRIGGGTNGARIEDATVRINDPGKSDAKPNMRGIWMEEGTNALIDGCSIEITDLTGTSSSGGVVVGKQFGSAQINNTTIQTNCSVPAINIRTPTSKYNSDTLPSMRQLPSNRRIVCENLDIYGAAPSKTAIRLAGRHKCQFKHVNIQHLFGDRDGIALRNGKNTRIRDCHFRVSGMPVVTHNSTPVISDLSTGGVGSIAHFGDSLIDTL